MKVYAEHEKIQEFLKQNEFHAIEIVDDMYKRITSSPVDIPTQNIILT